MPALSISSGWRKSRSTPAVITIPARGSSGAISRSMKSGSQTQSSLSRTRVPVDARRAPMFIGSEKPALRSRVTASAKSYRALVSVTAPPAEALSMTIVSCGTVCRASESSSRSRRPPAGAWEGTITVAAAKAREWLRRRRCPA